MTMLGDGRKLLDHPYYRLWQEGMLTRADLAEYAAQYRHVERTLPSALEAVAHQLPDSAALDLVLANLADELGTPRPHVDLFESFAAAVDAPAEVPPTPATVHLVDVYRDAAASSATTALAVIGAYEVQAAEVAATKAASLRAWFGMDGTDVEFWDVHARLEESHASWTLEALRELDAPNDETALASALSAGAWWSFLDERLALRTAACQLEV